MHLTLGELAERLDAELHGNADVVIRSVAGIREAREGDITFVANRKYEAYLSDTQASAVIVPPGLLLGSIPALETKDPMRTYLEVLQIFEDEPDRPEPGIDATAVIAESAQIGENVAIGAHVVVEAGARIGNGATVMAGSYVGHRTIVGVDCLLYPHVVLREDVEIGNRCILHPGVVVGSDGFGFAPGPNGHMKIPQIGKVIIEDDVEIGANSAIDRATTGVTRIGRGTKIDNLVHVAHNVEIGSDSILCAQVGISGSTRLGRQVTLAGQAGLIGHIEVGDRARVGAQAGVTKSIPPEESVSGYPAINHSRAQRVYASMRHLPDLLRTVRDLERRIAELEGDTSIGATEGTDEGTGNGRVRT